MASLRKDRDGVYFVDLRIDGDRKRITLNTRDRTVANIRMKQTVMELGERLPARRMTLTEFTSDYLAWAVPPLKSPNTVKTEKETLKRFARDVQLKFLDQLTVKQCDDFIGAIAKNNSPAYANKINRTLRSILGVAVKWGCLKSVPFKEVKFVRFEHKEPRILTPIEVHKLLDAARKLPRRWGDAEELARTIEIYLYTGLRRGEGTRLSWSDVDTTRNVIKVRLAKGKVMRYVPMMKRVRKILEGRQHQERPIMLSDDLITRVYKAAAIAAGIPDTTLHDLRRSFVTYMVEAGYPFEMVQQWVGHTDVDVTKIYYLGTPERVRKKMAGFELDLDFTRN